MFYRNNYHFIGIGGIGISAIARMLHLQGKNVSGSDAAQSEITDDLGKLGIKVSIGQNTENIPTETDVVIYTVAIPENNPELVEAKRRQIPCLTYPEALGELSKKMFTIAISGTHGKTTTTAMIGHILKKAGLDPTIIVGSKILGEDSNFLAGKSKYLVVEACEYKRSFLNLRPQILVITNIDEDHLDYYKDLEDIQSAFRQLVIEVPKNGFIVTNIGDKNISPVLKSTNAETLDYSDMQIKNKIGVDGEHNLMNARAAIKVAELLDVNPQDANKYLEDFKGTWRRLEYVGQSGRDVLYSDYAHHPTAIKASLKTLRSIHPDRELICVYEAHQQGRTRTLFNDFVDSLKLADRVFVAPIYIVREIDDGVTTNTKLAAAINKFVPAAPVEDATELAKELSKIKTDARKCIVLMGAGNIYKWTAQLLK